MSVENVVALRPVERPYQDDDQIASIYQSLGSASGEQVIARALGELALAMSGLADRVKAHELGDLLRRLRRLQRMAENLGLVTLSQVAGDLGKCLNANDATAFSSVWARLLRIAERTFSFDREKYEQSQP